MDNQRTIVGIDVGKADCHAAILHPGTDTSTTTAARSAATRLVADRHELAAILIAKLADGPPAIIAAELTGNLALPILEALEQTDHELLIAQHTDTAALRTLLRLRKKTDALDAVLIARLVALRENPATAELISANLTPWRQMRAAVLGRAKARHYQKLTRDKVRHDLRAKAAHFAEARSFHLAESKRVAEQITAAERDLTDSASPSALLLATIPLVTIRRACILDAAIGDVSRFPTPDKLVAYCRVAPGWRPQSGQTEGKLRRPRALAMLAVELHTFAIVVANPRTSTAGIFRATYERVKARSDGRAGMWAVKRQLIRTCWGVLTSGQPFRPKNREAVQP